MPHCKPVYSVASAACLAELCFGVSATSGSTHPPPAAAPAAAPTPPPSCVLLTRVWHTILIKYMLLRHRHNYSRPSQAYHIYQAGRPHPFPLPPSLSSCLSCFILSLNHNHLVSQVIKHVALANTLSRSCKGELLWKRKEEGREQIVKCKFQWEISAASANILREYAY